MYHVNDKMSIKSQWRLKGMKIVVLTGSPHKDGTSALMAENL